jgi:hypothetical protein
MRTMKGKPSARLKARTCFEGGGRMKRQERRMLNEVHGWELEETYGDEEPPICCATHNRLPGDGLEGILHWS